MAVANGMAVKDLVVLIADSKSYSRALLRSMLSQMETKAIHEVPDGASAIDVICSVNPDIMIVDWDLPILSVREVLAIVRSQGAVPNPDLPVIVISSSGHSAHVHEAIKLGAQHFMVRPISPKGLEQRVRRTVKASRQAARAYNIHGPGARRASANPYGR